MSDPILLFLTLDAAALLLVGAFATLMPASISAILATTLSGLGTLLCLPPLIVTAPSTPLIIPFGPPGLSVQLALDPLSLFFLLMVLLPATILATYRAAAVSASDVASTRMMTFCVGGTVLALLAADGVALAVGAAVACGAIWHPHTGRRRLGPLLVPLLILGAVCLLTPAGDAPQFDAIRAAPIDPARAAAAAALTFAAMVGLVRGLTRPEATQTHANQCCATHDTLIAGVLIPFGSYLLLRMTTDLAGAAVQAWWGFALLLAGGSEAVLQGWRAASYPEMDGAIAALMRRQAGLVMTGVGLALVARATDLPESATFALQATCLTVLGVSLAGTLTSLATHAIGGSAGTFRLSRLGGLIHTMPRTAAALAAGLLTLSALPPGLGFASLWLSFQSILAAPRTGGLPSQLPLALVAGALALSAATATAASVRIIGIAILGRPRTPQGARAQDGRSAISGILLTVAAVCLLIGLLPGRLLRLLAEPVIRAVTDTSADAPAGLALLVSDSAAPGYLALPVFALLALATGAVILARRKSRPEPRIAGPWSDGMPPPAGFPFGEPAAQSTGAGFLPTLPRIPAPHLPRVPTPFNLRPPSPAAGIWLLLVAFGVLLLVVAVMQ